MEPEDFAQAGGFFGVGKKILHFRVGGFQWGFIFNESNEGMGIKFLEGKPLPTFLVGGFNFFLKNIVTPIWGRCSI